MLTLIKSNHNICLHDFYARVVVKWLGHCFRHVAHPVTRLLSLPLDGRLAELRMQGVRGEVSAAAWSIFESLTNLGVEVEPPVSGSLSARGQPAYPIRWGEGWFGFGLG